MFDALEKLRQKPAHTRRMIAFVVTVVVSIIVVIFWFKGIVSTINKATFITKDSGAVAPLKALSNNVTEIFSNFKQGFEGLKGDLSAVKDSISTSTATTTPQEVPQGENTLENKPQSDSIDTYEREGITP
jgi:hypothetical protein